MQPLAERLSDMHPTVRTICVVCGAAALVHVVFWAFTGVSLVTPLGERSDLGLPSFTEYLRGCAVAALHVAAVFLGAAALDD